MASAQSAEQPPPSLPTTSLFRLRDLPEELQGHIIDFCLPLEWSIRASAPIRTVRPKGSTNPYIYGLRCEPPLPTSLYLVDKHASLQLQTAAVKSFTGHLYLASVVDDSDVQPYYQYGLGQDPNSGRLDSFRNLVTTIHMGCYQYLQDFKGFDLSLLKVLPNARTVVAHSNNRLHEESLYGWGDARHLVNMLPETALIKYMLREHHPQRLRPSTGFLDQLWDADIETLLEMKVNMGSGEMMVSFYVVFWLRKDQDAVVLGKHFVDEWLGSSNLRKSVYEKAL